MDTVVADENKKQAVIFVWVLVGYIALVILSEVSSPDDMKTAKMWSALKVKRLAQWGSDELQRLAGKAATVYNREKA